MLIGENYKIESNDLNVILLTKKTITGKGTMRPTKKAVGEEYWIPIAYFATVKHALNYLVDHEIRGTGFTDLESITAKIDQLHNLIQNLKA